MTNRSDRASAISTGSAVVRSEETPPFGVGEWVVARSGEVGRVERIEPQGAQAWYLILRSQVGYSFGAYAIDCTPASRSADPLARFAALVEFAEVAVEAATATEEGKAIAMLAAALRAAQGRAKRAESRLLEIRKIAGDK